jgi:hypothetical protein
VVTPARRDRHREGQVIFAHSRLGRRRRLAWRARRAPASGACSGHERHAAVASARSQPPFGLAGGLSGGPMRLWLEASCGAV